MKQVRDRRPKPCERPPTREAAVTALPTAHASALSLRRLCVAVLLASLMVVVFDTTGLRVWASRMPLGPVRDGLLAVIEPLDSAAGEIGLSRPRRLASQGFGLALGEECDAGWGEAPSAAATASPASRPVRPKRKPPKVYTAENPLRVLLVGDSLIGWGLGTELEASLRADPATDVTRKCTVSSGLSRPDFYNWPAQVRALVNEADYDIVVGIMGGNDIQGLYYDERVHGYGSEGWTEGYRALSREFIDLLAGVSRKAYWVALPPMREACFHAETREINTIHRALCGEYPDVEYVVMDRVIGEANGRYALHKVVDGRRVQMRAGDGVHMSLAGGRLMADEMLRRFFRDFAVEGHLDAHRQASVVQSEDAPWYVPDAARRASLRARANSERNGRWYLPSSVAVGLPAARGEGA